jgi:serine phosphatase RsbU (regulator of sigma subunit)
VVVAEVDELALERFGQWPWPRTVLAGIIDKLASMEPLAIGLDIVMPEPDANSPSAWLARLGDVPELVRTWSRTQESYDAKLAEIISKAPVVVGMGGLRASSRVGGDGARVGAGDSTVIPGALPSFRVVGDDAVKYLPSMAEVLTNVEPIQSSATGAALLNTLPDADGVVRRMQLAYRVDGMIWPALGLEMLRVGAGVPYHTVFATEKGIEGFAIGDFGFETEPDGGLRLHYDEPDGRRFFSVTKLLDGEIPREWVAGHYVIVGVTGLGLKDVTPTPVAGRMDGVEIQAQLIESIIERKRLRQEMEVLGITLPSIWLEFGWLSVFGIALIGVLPVSRGWVMLLVPPIAVLATLVGSGLAFTHLALLVDSLWPSASLVVVSGILVTARWYLTERQRRQLSTELEIARIEHARIEGELGAARRIQASLLPDIERLDWPKGVEIAARLTPAREVGGDFYECLVRDDDRVFFAIADVSGKGVPASIFMAVSKTLCKVSGAEGEASAAVVLSETNTAVERENQSMMFVTAAAGFLSPDGRLDLSVAGHEPPFIVRKDGRVEQVEVVGGPPLGALAQFDYTGNTAMLEPGDALVLVTDGVTEATDAKGDLFGSQRLRDVLSLGPFGSADAVVTEILSAIAAFVGEAEQSDDLTVLALRCADDYTSG